MNGLRIIGILILLFGFLRAESQCTLEVTYLVTPTCPGGKTGKIQLVMASGTPSYRVFLNNATTPAVTTTTKTAVLQDLSAGTYSVRVADLQGCVRIFSAIVVGSTQVPKVTIDVPSQVCIGDAFNVSAVLDASYEPPYSYVWNNGKTSASFTDVLKANTPYLVTVTDAKGCKGSASASVVANSKPGLAMPASVQSCPGETLKLAPTGVSGGTPAYMYNWNTGSRGNSIEVAPSITTTYTLTVTDSKGCAATASTKVEPTKTLSVTMAGRLELCAEMGATLSPTVGNNGGGLTYAWSTGASTSSISIVGDVQKSISVTVSDAVGCSGAATTLVVVQVPPVINLPDQLVVCNNALTILDPALPSSQGPYTYRWSTGASTAVLSLKPTTDQTVGLTITDAKKCSREKRTVLDVVAVPDVRLPTSVFSCANAPLTLTALVTGGTPNFQYLWSTGQVNASLTWVFQKDETIRVRVVDTNGCTDSTETLVRVYAPPVVAFNSVPETCPGQSVSLTPLVSGGSGGYTYSWSTGGNTLSTRVAPLVATTYSLTVTDANTCSAQASTTVVPSKMLEVTLPTDLSFCQKSGFTLTPTVTGGTAPLSFAWNTGDRGAVLSLSAETDARYAVTVTDVLGCTGSVGTAVKVHNAPFINLPEQVTTCSGGTVILNPNLETSQGPYTYRWSNGATTAALTLQPTASQHVGLTVTDAHTCTRDQQVEIRITPGPTIILPDVVQACSHTEFILRALVQGGVPEYSFNWSIGATEDFIKRVFTREELIKLQVRDSAGCSAVDSVWVRVVEPPSFALPPSLTVCRNQRLPIHLANLSGNFPFTIRWNTGQTDTAIVVYGDTTKTLSVQVTDVAGCGVSASVAVQVVGIDDVALFGDTSICIGDSTRLEVKGEMAGLSLLWSNGSKGASTVIQPLTSSKVEVWLENQRGCRDTLATQVTISALPEVSLPQASSVCAGDSLLLVPVIGRVVPPVSFTWEDGQGTIPRILRNVQAGNFSLTVSDANGCKKIVNTSVQVNPTPRVMLPESIVACAGTTISILPETSAPAGMAKVQWSTGQQTIGIAHVVTDTLRLSCVLTDDKGCIGLDSTRVVPVPKPTIELPDKASACVGERLRFTPRSAAGDSYSIQWNTGVIAPFVEVLAQQSTTLQAVATNVQGCKDTAQVYVEVYPLPVLNILGDRSYCASNPGILSAAVQGGAAPYRFLWSTGSDQPSVVVTTTNNSGVVQLQVHDAHGCQAQDTAQVSILAPPVIHLEPIAPVCEKESAYLGPVVTGGVAPYRYLWSTGDTLGLISVGAGTYSFAVTDAKGCQATLAMEVEERKGPEVMVLNLRRPDCNRNNGLLELGVDPNVSPVQFQWSTGALGSRLEHLFPGVYQVAVIDSFNCQQELEFNLVCGCTAAVGKMDLQPIAFCKGEERVALYDASSEVLPPGMRKWFVLHNSAGAGLGNRILRIDTLPKVLYTPGMVSDKTYFLSAVFASEDAQGAPNLGDPCLVVSPGTPIILRPTPEKPSQLLVPDTLVCPGSTILISTNRQETGFTYVWQTPRGVFKTGTPALTVANFGPQDIGSYQVSVQAGVCVSPWLGALRLAISSDVAEIFAEPDKVVCGRDSTLLQANAPQGATGRWLTSSSATIEKPEQETTPAYGLVPGKNIFLWTVITRNCIIQDTLEVYYTPMPVLQDDTVALDDEKNTVLFDMLQNDSIRDIPERYLKISLLSQPASGTVLLDSVGNIIYVRDNTIGEDQELTFRYQVCNTDATGVCPGLCDEAQVILKVAYSPRTLIYPSIGLRPGQHNPLWQFEAARPMFSARLSIVDRWGQVVYREAYSDIQKGELVKSWNGVRGNTLMPPGAYYFTLEGIVEDNEKVVQNGIFYLLE